MQAMTKNGKKASAAKQKMAYPMSKRLTLSVRTPLMLIHVNWIKEALQEKIHTLSNNSTTRRFVTTMLYLKGLFILKYRSDVATSR